MVDILKRNHDTLEILNKNGTLALISKLSHIDLESNSRFNEQPFLNGLSLIDESIRIRFISMATSSTQSATEHSRTQAESSLFFKENKLFISLEKKMKYLSGKQQISKAGYELRSALNSILSSGLLAQRISNDDLNTIINEVTEEKIIKPYGVETAEKAIGIMSLMYPAKRLNKYILSNFKAKYSDFAIVTNIKRVKKEKLQFTLKKNIKTLENSAKLSDHKRQYETEKAIEQNELYNTPFFEIAVTLFVYADCEVDLKERLKAIKSDFYSMGQVHHEGITAFMRNHGQKISGNGKGDFVETLDNLDCLLPIYSYSDDTAGAKKNGLLLHTNDQNKHFFNVFNPLYTSYSGVIIGKTGLGKSVFSNLLLKSISNDNNSLIHLIDVKGSYKSLTSKLNGRHIKIDIDSDEGLNIFLHLGKVDSLSKKEILAHYLCSLVEFEPTNEVLSQISNSFKIGDQFIDLDDFYNRSSEFDGKKHLKIWVNKGLKAQFFRSKSELKRFNYYNFEKLSSASDKKLSKTIISTILSIIHLQLLGKKDDEKIYLVIDESPFFISSSFNELKFLIKNVRKLNGSLILIAQDAKDLVYKGDTSLIESSNFKIIFSANEEACKLLNLTPSEKCTVSRLSPVKNQYSHFLLSDEIQSKELFLYLTEKELLNASSEAEIFKKIKEIEQKHPNVSKWQAYEILNILNSSGAGV